MLDNITHLLQNFIDCGEFENIVFVWVMHEQSIIDALKAELHERDFRFYNFSLVCSPDVLKRRIECDVADGIRTTDVIERSIPRLPLYEILDSIKINTDELNADAVADIIRNTVT